MKPIDIVRTEKKMYEDNYKGKDISDDEWIDILIEHPRLMKRPIVVSETKAVLAIPPEKIQDLL
jgi:arsenate reductase-like glutaredoxin family protein